MARSMKSKIKTPQDEVRLEALAFMKQHPAEYESHLLALAIRDSKFARTYHEHIGIDPKTDNRVFDFENPLHNAIWFSIVKYRETLITAGTNKDLSVNASVIRRTLGVLTKTDPQPCGIGENRIGEAVVEFIRVSKLDAEDYLAYARLTASDWLGTRRVIREAQNTPMESLVAIEWVADLNEQIIRLPGKRQEELQEIGLLDALSLPDEKFNCVPTGYHVIDSILGGGFPKGFAALGAAPQGGGKTVSACMLSSGMSFSGAYGTLLSTERSVGFKQLAQRILASMGILYTTVKGSNFQEILQNPQYADIIRQIQELHTKLRLRAWPKGQSGKRFKDILRSEIETSLEKFDGKLDYLMLDWIGAALTEDIMDDMDKQRLLFKFAGEACADLSAEYNVALIAWAQIKLDNVKSKKVIRMADLAECKTIAEQMPTFFGISCRSSVNEKEMEKDGLKEREAYDKKQYWTFDKLRTSEAKIIEVYREFEYQRWKFPEKVRLNR